MTKKKSYIFLIIIISVGVIIDLISKSIFADVLIDGDIIIIPNLLKFTYVENTGAAFGILGGKVWLLIIISIIFVIAFVIFDLYNHSLNKWYLWGIGLIVSGAIGNFVDRIFLGFVRDFISIKFFNFVFNIADMCITFGIICFGIYLIMSILKEVKAKKEKENNANDN